jgi:hypothetical protein
MLLNLTITPLGCLYSPPPHPLLSLLLVVIHRIRVMLFLHKDILPTKMISLFHPTAYILLFFNIVDKLYMKISKERNEKSQMRNHMTLQKREFQNISYQNILVVLQYFGVTINISIILITCIQIGNSSHIHSMYNWYNFN